MTQARARLTVTVSVEIDHPQEQVFGYLTDVRRHGVWSPKPFRIAELTSPGDDGAPVPQPLDGPGAAVIGKGTRFVSYGWLPGDPDHRNDVEVTELDAPNRFVLTATDRGHEFVNTFTVTPTERGCRVVRTLDLPRPSGFVGRLAPITLVRVIRPDLDRGLKKLRAIFKPL